MSKAMTMQQIVDALQKKPSSAACHDLVRACEPRRQELRARLAAIDPSRRPGIVPDPPAVGAARLKGPQGVIEQQQEREALTVELDQMDHVERLCHQAEADARRAELRADIPAAVKRLPELVEHLRETMENFDAAIGATQRALDAIAAFDEVGFSYPFNDSELAGLLELRAEVWRVRSLGVPHHVPAALADEPGEVGERVKAFARSWALLYVTGRPGTLTTRKPPAEVPQHEFVRAADAIEKPERRRFSWPSLA